MRIGSKSRSKNLAGQPRPGAYFNGITARPQHPGTSCPRPDGSRDAPQFSRGLPQSPGALHSFLGRSTEIRSAAQFPRQWHELSGSFRFWAWTPQSGIDAVETTDEHGFTQRSKAATKGIFLNRKQRQWSFLVPLRSLLAPVEQPGYGLALFIRLGTGESRGRGDRA
jgi:hypothetical protein